MGAFLDLFKSLFKTISKLSRPYFTLEENDLKFKIDSDTFFHFPISNIETKTRIDPYVLEAYTLKADHIHLEYIHTDIDVNWNGEAFSFFKNLLKSELGLSYLELLEKREFKHYDFVVYKTNNDYILNLIHIYEINKDVFIIDTNSKLYESLLKNFDKKYEYKFEKNIDEFENINISLAKNNALYSFFNASGG